MYIITTVKFIFSGRILNVETQDMKFHSWTGSVDADESFWYEEGKYGTYFLNITRLFYEQGNPAYEEVGMFSTFLCGNVCILSQNPYSYFIY